jgi:hypothetical protein
MFTDQVNKLRQYFQNNYTKAGLKALIVLWAIVVAFVAVFLIDNEWVLAGILAWEILP